MTIVVRHPRFFSTRPRIAIVRISEIWLMVAPGSASSNLRWAASAPARSLCACARSRKKASSTARPSLKSRLAWSTF